MKTTWRTLKTKASSETEGICFLGSISVILGSISKKLKNKISEEELLDYEIIVKECDFAGNYKISLIYKDTIINTYLSQESFNFTKEEYLTI